MSFLTSNLTKLLVSILALVLSILSQWETKDDVLLSDTTVVLPKNSAFIYDTLTKVDDYPTWFTKFKHITSIDSSKFVDIGKKYKVTSSLVFGLGVTTSTLMITGHTKPSYFEFIVDNLLLERYRLTFEDLNSSKTRVHWKVYSRRKSVFYRYFVAPFCRFYINQILREGLLTLKFSF